MRKSWAVLSGLVVLALAGCSLLLPKTTPTALPATPTPSATLTLPLAPTATPTITPTMTPDPARPWGRYEGPSLPSVTQIPYPATRLDYPDEIQVLALLGTDRPAPYISRTDQITLVIYHPRLAKAALLSLPPDLLVYIPGYTMQRLGVAYAVSGARGFQRTIEYNFGLRPDSWAFIHNDDFKAFIDDIGGIEATILQPIPNLCGGLPQGTWMLNGEQALCYATFRLGADEPSRNRRQQEVLRLTLQRLIYGGNLVRLPELWEAYAKTVETDLTLNDLLEAIPLALKFGDPNRMRYYTLQTDELPRWDFPSDDRARVFLPDPTALQTLMNEALTFVQVPAALAEVVVTLQYELTVSPTPSETPLPTYTFTPTYTPTATRTLVPTATYTRTMTFTPSATFTPSPTRTATFTITPSLTITPSYTASQTPTPTTTLTPTP